MPARKTNLMCDKNFFWRHWVCAFAIMIGEMAFAQPDSLAFHQKLIALQSIRKGQKISVESTYWGVIEGKFRKIKNDTLLLSTGSAKRFALPVSDLASLWVRTDLAREGGKLGAILGVIPGAIWGGTLAAGLANIDCESHCVNPMGPMLIGGAIGGLVGAASGGMLGATIGAMVPEWQRVYP